MDSAYDISFSSYEDISKHNSTRKGDLSISDQLEDFERLRISALTKAAEMSPLVKEVTIGPNSPSKRDDYRDIQPVVEKPKVEENLVEDKLREDLRYTLIMKQCENRIQENYEERFKNILDNLLSNRAEVMSKYWKKQGEECERRALEFKARKLQMMKRLQENDNSTFLERARLDEKNCQIVNTETIDNMNRILEEQNRATARFAAITDSHTKICIYYNEISNILNTEPLGKTACERYMVAINTVVGNISAIMDICKTGAINDKDVKQAEILALNIENIRRKISEDLEALKQEELTKKLKEEELLKKEIEEKKAQELQAAAAAEKAKSAPPKKSRPIFFSAKNYSYYEDLKNYLDQYEAQYKDLLQDVNLKKFRFDCQKAVNTPVNALSSVSSLHMKDKYDKLSKLLKGETVQVLDIHVKATQHPQGLYYCTALLAKKIVRQGDLLVSSNTEAAYPLAAVTVALWAQFPHFGKLVEAYFHRMCPYLVPMYLPQKEGQTDKEFYLSRGYTYNDEGVVEKQDKFLKRMTGIFRLRCAIWTAKMPKFMNTPHPQGLRNGWQWLASFINLQPEPDISATLIHDFYIMCGSEFNKFYGKQFRKILELTSSQYLKILEDIDEGGPKTRLEVYLQTVLKSNDVPSPPVPAQQINW
ncbi:gle1 RNA export mediator [Anticarsia gemmatalis]|uniref:gle1 RNA export mediator n=1 Tax=Anticarsia gemmatalis TaxID=129554 RepID=UPI003F76BB35